MATIHRPPLGERRDKNEVQVNKAQDDHSENKKLVGERNIPSKRSILDLKRDLARVQQKMNTKEQEGPQPSQRSSTPNDSLEIKLQDLVKRHQTSKSKHMTEITSLKKINEELQQASTVAKDQIIQAKGENERLKSEIQAIKTAYAKETESTRSVHDEQAESLNKEITALKQQLEVVKSSLTDAMTDDQRKWDEEKRALKRELEILKLENERLVSREADVEEMEDQREWMEGALAFAAIKCGEYHKSSVDIQAYEKCKNRVEEAKIDLYRAESVNRSLERETQSLREEVDSWRMRAQEAVIARQEAESMLESVLEERRKDRLESTARDFILDDISPLDSLVGAAEIDRLEQQYDGLTILSTRIELQEALSTLRLSCKELKQQSKQFSESQSTVHSLQHDQRTLQEKCLALEAEHAKKGNQIISLEQEIARWQHAEQTVAAELAIVKMEHDRLKSRSKEHKEVLKRANDTVMRSKSAEDAFEQEIIQLRDALDEAAQYRDLYNDLVEEHRLLSIREKVAVDEAQRVGMQNAELLGHANGDQRISYVDSLRHEMALTKHELVSVRHQLNKATETVKELQDEVDAYKNVDLGAGMNASTRTRVVRRVPEGSWLGSSTARRSTRSVSGPGR